MPRAPTPPGNTRGVARYLIFLALAVLAIHLWYVSTHKPSLGGKPARGATAASPMSPSPGPAVSPLSFPPTRTGWKGSVWPQFGTPQQAQTPTDIAAEFAALHKETAQLVAQVGALQRLAEGGLSRVEAAVQGLRRELH
eukprot:RCo004499